MNKKDTTYQCIGIIYKATNLVNGKVYIGQTVQDFERYTKNHIKLALKNNDKNKKHFYRAIRKYSPENFSWEIIDEADLNVNIETLNLKEIYWIRYYKSYGENDLYDDKFGYNMTKGGESTFGIIFSDDHKNKISLSKKGKPAHNKGKKFTEQQRENSRISHKNQRPTEEQIINIKNGLKNARDSGKIFGMKGKKHSEESKIKVSKKLKGRKFSDEHKSKIGAKSKGRKLSEKQKEKISQNNKNKVSGSSKTYIFCSPNNIYYEVYGAFRSFCKDNKLNPKYMIKTSRNLLDNYKGWKCFKLDIVRDIFIREKYIKQIKIEEAIKYIKNYEWDM